MLACRYEETMNLASGPGLQGSAGLYDAQPVSNHYDALGVPARAGASDIRQAYLAAARLHHPDFHVADDEVTRSYHARQMQLANEAWEILGDVSARQLYDASIRLAVGPPTERIRPDRDPVTPPGKGWTPRRSDDGWQRDFRAWADEDETLAPDRPGARRNRGVLSIVPIALFGLAVLCGFLGLVLSARPLIAAGFISLALSGALFVMLPIFEMSRGRHRD